MDIFPSLISADLLNLERVINTLEPISAGFHIDVMDNHFVPNLTWGPDFLRAFIKSTEKPLHIHFMVTNPFKWLDFPFRSYDIFIFHYESFKMHQKRIEIIGLLKKRGVKIGVAVNPATKIKKIASILGLIDHVLIMSVEPGFSGQKFIEGVIPKIKQLCDIKKTINNDLTIGIDGGVTKELLPLLNSYKIDCAAMASAIFFQKDYEEALRHINILAKLAT